MELVRTLRSIEILVVCTANVARSPMAAALLASRLEARLLDARVTSAGVLPMEAGPAPEGVAVMAGRGLDISTHRSRALARPAIDEADLVLGMERRHVREVVVLVPSAFGRSFTLKELVRRGEAVGARRPGESLPAWLSRVHQGREAATLLEPSPDDDIADPIGHPMERFEGTAAELDTLLDRLVALLWPSGGRGST